MEGSMTIRTLAMLACSGVALAAGSAAAQEKTLVLACYAGDIQKYLEQDIIPGFEAAFGAKVEYIPGVSMASIAKLQAEKDNPQIDVACLDDGPQQQAKALGLLQPTAASAMPNLAQVYDVAKMSDGIGVGWALFATGIVYNPEEFAAAGIAPPTSWNDLANPALKDHVVVDSITSTYGLQLLIMLAHANGGSETNIDPGFAKMAEIAPGVVDFDTTADLSKYFQQGEAWIGVWTNSEANAYAMTTGFPMAFVYPTEGAPALMATANVAKNAPHAELADAFLNYLVGVEAQTVVGKSLGFGPVNSGVTLTPEEAAKVTYGAEAASHLMQMDWATINDQRPAWTDRWNREIER
jgi:putative spermidine/putrescine transport system substrate-binding protein